MNCTTCKHLRGQGSLVQTCEFPLPSWLTQIVSALDSARNISYVAGAPLTNEVYPDRPYSNCPTWEAIEVKP